MGKHLTFCRTEFLIDDCFDDLISHSKWTLLKSKRGTPYVRTSDNRKGHRIHGLIHRLLLGALPSEEVDHVNGNGLDNRMCNLRLVTRKQNRANSKARHDAISGLRGIRKVSYSKSNPWQVRITQNGKRSDLGHFRTRQEAIIAYNKAMLEINGEYARLNKEE